MATWAEMYEQVVGRHYAMTPDTTQQKFTRFINGWMRKYAPHSTYTHTHTAFVLLLSYCKHRPTPGKKTRKKNVAEQNNDADISVNAIYSC